MAIISTICFFSTVLFVVIMLGQIKYSDQIEVNERLEQMTQKAANDTVFEEWNLPLTQRIILPMWNRLLELGQKLSSPEKKSVYQKKLMLAGEPYGLDADGFIVVKYVLLSVGILIGLWLGFIKMVATTALLVIAGLAILGYLLPDFVLKSWQTSRQEAIIRSLPDILDMLCVSVEAGLGFDAAVQKVTEKSMGPLAEEFQKTLSEIKVGKPRREALKDMASRIEVDDVSTFVGAMVQADQLGVSISNVLKVQSDQVREKRKQRAEEKAQKAPIKMLIPLVLFIFPCLFIVLLGPAVLNLMQNL
ncbi:MAG: type II secretion system F family protein [Acidobacteriota bacterium]